MSSRKCAACGWLNANVEPLCFNCSSPLQALNAATAAPALPPATARQDAVFAGVAARVWATLIDGALMIVSGAVILAVGMGWDQGGSAQERLLVTLLLVLLALALPALLDAWTAGSIGKRLLGIRVATGSAARPGVLRSLLRHLFKYGGHLTIPVLLFVFEHLLFGPRHLHEVVARTCVVRADAADADVRSAAATRTRGNAIGTVLAAVVVLLLLLFGGVLAMVLFSAPGDDSAARPQRAAVRSVWKATMPLTVKLQKHHQRTGAFPASVDAVGYGLPASLGTLQFDPESGRIVVVAVAQPIAGARIVWVPVWGDADADGRRAVLSWHCGSGDVPARELPVVCNDVVEGP